MPIPDYQTLMRPVLGCALDREKTAREVIDEIARLYDLSEEDVAERIPSGSATLLANRVHWAVTYMVQARLLERPRRAVIIATERGRAVYTKHPERIDNAVLKQFPEFLSFQQRRKTPLEAAGDPSAGKAEQESDDDTTPLERIDEAARQLTDALRQDLLERILQADPQAFEKLIIELMLAMGYGGPGAGRHLGKTADGGVDGVINEDPLGLDVVFLQAKRYAPGNSIGVQQIREFAGSLDERGAVKGVFVTTSSFAAPAVTYSERSPKRLILIDGDALTHLLIRYDVGVRLDRKIELKKLDDAYFDGLV